MRVVNFTHRNRSGNLLHVETPLGIVNIRIGLHDAEGREVVSVETIPDRYAGEPQVERDGHANVRLIQLRPDRYGRSWYLGTKLCPECGQPDNSGDCTHERLTDKEASQIGVVR